MDAQATQRMMRAMSSTALMDACGDIRDTIIAAIVAHDDHREERLISACAELDVRLTALADAQRDALSPDDKPAKPDPIVDPTWLAVGWAAVRVGDAAAYCLDGLQGRIVGFVAAVARNEVCVATYHQNMGVWAWLDARRELYFRRPQLGAGQVACTNPDRCASEMDIVGRIRETEYREGVQWCNLDGSWLPAWKIIPVTINPQLDPRNQKKGGE